MGQAFGWQCYARLELTAKKIILILHYLENFNSSNWIIQFQLISNMFGYNFGNTKMQRGHQKSSLSTDGGSRKLLKVCSVIAVLGLSLWSKQNHEMCLSKSSVAEIELNRQKILSWNRLYFHIRHHFQKIIRCHMRMCPLLLFICPSWTITHITSIFSKKYQTVEFCYKIRTTKIHFFDLQRQLATRFLSPRGLTTSTTQYFFAIPIVIWSNFPSVFAEPSD